jgi:hypothetical protein
MTSFGNILQKLRALQFPLNPPATPADLARLEVALDRSLPMSLRTLYLQYNGQDTSSSDEENDNSPQILFRLLPIDELITTYQDMQSEWFDEYPDLLRNFIPCWTDDNSNYMLLFTGTYLTERIVYLDHELGFNPRPLFTDLHSFYASMLDAARQGRYSFETDYPIPNENNLHDHADEASFIACFQAYHSAQEEYRRLYFAYLAMYVCPFSCTAQLYDFLQDGDDRIQGEVCPIFALRQWLDAIPLLGNVIIQGQSLSLVPAIRALGDFQQPLAAQELIRVTDYMHPYDLSFVTEQLQRYGYEIREKPHGNGKYTTYEIRQPSNGTWQELHGYDVSP